MPEQKKKHSICSVASITKQGFSAATRYTACNFLITLQLFKAVLITCSGDSWKIKNNND